MSANESRPYGAASEAERPNPILPAASGIGRIGASVDGKLEEVLWQLIDGTLELWQLAPGLAAWWHVAYAAGRDSRQAEVDYLDHECSRYYYEFCRRQSRPLWDPNSPSFAEMEERRGNPENAARVRRFMSDLFAEVSL